MAARGSLSQRLTKSRDNANLTLKGLAELVGVSHQTIWNYENRDLDPSPPLIFALSDALSVDPRWLVTGVATSQEPKHSAAVMRIAQAVERLPEDKRNALATLLGVPLDPVRGRLRRRPQAKK